MDNVIKTKPVSINIKVLIMRFLMKSYKRGIIDLYYKYDYSCPVTLEVNEACDCYKETKDTLLKVLSELGEKRMRLIRERQRDDFVNYVYEMNGFDFKDAVHWVNSLVDKGIIITNVITLRDTMHSYDEGNNTIQLEYPFNQEQMLNKIEKKEVDIVSFNGKYKGVLIIVSYNLQNNVLVLGFDSKDNIDRVSLESELSLIGKGVYEFG